jgi:hypothetical protein
MLTRRAFPIAVVVLTLLTFVVHDVGYMLHHPYWLDESWVADSTRVPFRRIGDVTAVTPIGWTALLRAVVIGGDQRHRVIPLAFAALTVLVACFAGRAAFSRPRGRLMGGVLAGTGALLLPSALVRNDLKQYTADAFVAVLLLWLLLRLESEWSRRRLIEFGAVAVAGMFISHTTLFVATSAMLAVIAVQLLSRSWRRFREACVTSAATAVGLAVVYVVFDQPHVVPGLTSYWAGYFMPWHHGLHADWAFIKERLHALHYVGLGNSLVCAAFVLLGLVALLRLGRYAAALMFPILIVELLGASAARRYPLLDVRTSHFLFTLLVVLAAIGVAGVTAEIARAQHIVGWGLTALALGLFAWHTSDDVRARSIPKREDVRSQVQYVEKHRAPQDVILVNFGANWGFGYYYRAADPTIDRHTIAATTFVVDYPRADNVVITDGFGLDVLQTTFTDAATRASLSGGRLWVIRSHEEPGEAEQWQAVLAGYRVTTIDVGREPLLAVDVPTG